MRDFAYSMDSPLHYGKPDIKLENNSTISLSSPEFNGRDARALFDFTPETEYEIALKAGQSIWVQYRQCPVTYNTFILRYVSNSYDRAGLLLMYRMKLA